MSDASRHRRSAVARAVRQAFAVVVTAALLASCSGGDSSGRPAATPTTTGSSPSPSDAPTSADSTPTATRPTEQFAPTTAIPTEPGALGRQLDHAVARLQDRKSEGEVVRQAGEFLQLAARALALGSERFRRRVLAQLDPVAQQQVRGDVRAAQQLTVMTDPQPKFPSWRIVEPPPAPVLLGYYREAQRRTGVPWTYLAAIHLVETRMGRIRGTSTAGAQGPMQFLPSTWNRFGAGGDINDPRDAIHAAARLLDAYGAPGDMARALWHYNPSDRYVGAVTEYARAIGRTPAVYRGYWHWRVLYRHVRGTYVLPDGYPKVRPVLLTCPSCP